MTEPMNRDEKSVLNELDFHTKREIMVKDISSHSITIPLKYVQRSNAKPETMLYNLTKSINYNDISDIDYTAGASNIHELKPLGDRFCDNIILYHKIPVCEQSRIGDSTNKMEYLSKFLAEYTAKIKRLLIAHNINVTKRNIKPTYSSKECEYYKQYIKVALPTIPITDIFALITSEDAVKSFNNEGIYINDIDFTQDFAGVINKTEVIQYFIEIKNYVMEGYNDTGDYITTNWLVRTA